MRKYVAFGAKKFCYVDNDVSIKRLRWGEEFSSPFGGGVWAWAGLRGGRPGSGPPGARSCGSSSDPGLRSSPRWKWSGSLLPASSTTTKLLTLRTYHYLTRVTTISRNFYYVVATD